MRKYGSQYGAPEGRDTEVCMGHRNKEIWKSVWGTGLKRYGSLYGAPELRDMEVCMGHRIEEIRKSVWGIRMKRYGSQYGYCYEEIRKPV
jgi:hypothetical protein